MESCDMLYPNFILLHPLNSNNTKVEMTSCADSDTGLVHFNCRISCRVMPNPQMKWEDVLVWMGKSRKRQRHFIGMPMLSLCLGFDDHSVNTLDDIKPIRNQN